MKSEFVQCGAKARYAAQCRMWRRAASWLAFTLALTVYLLTVEPGASYWDCPEYIVTAWRLEPGHPPGNPFWTLTARIFTIIGMTADNAALAVNISSALFMAGGCGILASTLFYVLRMTLMRRRTVWTARMTGLFALCGAMTFGWADSPWYSAVEAEVYAMSLFMTALCVRMMIGWALMTDRLSARRHLLCIVYLIGLSIGVHQLNLLVIPVLVMIWYFRNHPRRSAWGTALWFMLSCAMVGLILLVMMPGVLWLCERCEWWCVNDLRLPYHSGVIICMSVLTAICISLAMCLRHTRYRMWGWVPVLLLTGYSVFFILLIRGAANPPMNEGAPGDIFALSSYLSRDQYGSAPLLYGKTPYSQPLRIEVIDSTGHATYNRYATRRRKDRIARGETGSGHPGYVKYGERMEYRYQPELNMLLPRLVSGNPDDIAAYEDWAGMSKSSMDSVDVSYALDSAGRAVGRLLPDGSRVRERALRPTYLHQLRYLLGYQIGYMYLRYMMWNYSGRQNDRFAVGEVEHGNFITGIDVIDTAMLGPQSALPAEIGRDNAGQNVYFMIPLLLGILGIIALTGNKGVAGQRMSRIDFVIFILFFMTGIAIVLYLNQNPREPRERDYSFLGSLWAYSIWIGVGMAWLWVKACGAGRAALRRVGRVVSVMVAVATPIWMLSQNYDDHDRSGRTAVEAYAGNLLNSLEKDAILFVNGDNYTFPLWYMQEVRGVRRDVTVVNMAYLLTPWYCIQMMRCGEESLPVSTTARPEDIAYGDFAHVYYRAPSAADTLDAPPGTQALRMMFDNRAKPPYISPVMRVPTPSGDTVYIAARSVSGGKNYIDGAALMVLDIIATNASSEHPRPVYWHDMLPATSYAGFKPYTVRDFQTRRLMLDIDTTAVYPAVMPAMESGGADDRGFYADETTGGMISRQRMSMVRYAGRLLNAGRAAEALDVARESERLYPACVWEYQVLYDADSVHHEGLELAGVKIRAGRILGDSAAVREGLELRDREVSRYSEWRRYREALPARLRNMMTSKNIRKAKS